MKTLTGQTDKRAVLRTLRYLVLMILLLQSSRPKLFFSILRLKRLRKGKEKKNTPTQGTRSPLLNEWVAGGHCVVTIKSLILRDIMVVRRIKVCRRKQRDGTSLRSWEEKKKRATHQMDKLERRRTKNGRLKKMKKTETKNYQLPILSCATFELSCLLYMEGDSKGTRFFIREIKQWPEKQWMVQNELEVIEKKGGWWHSK